MTTLAYNAKEGVIAADRLITSNGTKIGHTSKIGKMGTILFGAAGCLPLMQNFLGWMGAGMPDGIPNMKSGDQFAEGIIVYHNRIIVLSHRGFEMLDHENHALGSGCDFALAAMESGASAEEAVKIASKFCLYTGTEIDVLRR